MAKSKFVFKKNFGQDMNDLLASADENLGVYSSIKQETIPLNHVIVRENPRHLSITAEDIKNGLSEEDPLYEKKAQEYDELKRLAESIKEQGILYDIHVFEEGADFILVMGQRRVLASLLAEKKSINAKIWKERPSTQVLKAYQWVENFNREDLSLWDVIESACGMLKVCMQNKKISKITTREAGQILYCSKAKAAYFCNLVDVKQDVEMFVKEGKIKSLKLAATLNKIEDDRLRKKMLSDEKSLKESSIAKIKDEIKKKPKKKSDAPGVKPTRVKFGYTTNLKVAEHIIDKLCDVPELSDCRDEFLNANKDYRALSRVFNRILEKLEHYLNG